MLVVALLFFNGIMAVPVSKQDLVTRAESGPLLSPGLTVSIPFWAETKLTRRQIGLSVLGVVVALVFVYVLYLVKKRQ